LRELLPDISFALKKGLCVQIRWLLSCAALTSLVAGLPLIGPPASAATSEQVPRSTALTATKRIEVLLPTGNRIQVTDGRWVAEQTKSVGPEQLLIKRTHAGRRYLTPMAATPYLDSVLDYSLFDVAQLAKTQAADGRVPVTVSYQGSTPNIPGVTITSATGGVATGYLTAASAPRFGQALAAQWKADAAAGRRSRTTLFGGVKKISAAKPAKIVSTVTPMYVQYTLKVKVTGPDGKPEVFGQVELTNMDDQQKFSEAALVVDGEARFSLPKGHYWADAVDYVIDDDGVEHMRVTTLSDYTVKGSGQTLALDHRKANTSAKPTVPRTAVMEGFYFGIERIGADGRDTGMEINSEPFDLRYNPAPAAKVGTLKTYFQWRLSGGSQAHPYTYDLAAAAKGVPAKKTYAFTTADMATINARYYGDGTSHNSAFARFASYPGEVSGAEYGTPVTLGSARTEYVAATGSPSWTDELDLETTVDTSTPFLDSQNRPLPAGSTTSQTWARGPLAPGFAKFAATDTPWCWACRSKDSMYVLFSDITDSDNYHQGGGLEPADDLPFNRFRVYANGKKITDIADSDTGQPFTVPTASTSYRVLYDFDRRKAEPAQSTSSQTELTFTSKSGSGHALPSTWTCFTDDPCRMLPIVRARLSLPTDLQGRLPVGKSTVTVTVSGLQSAGTTVPKSASLQIHAANRGVWLPVELTSAGNGIYRGTITNTDEYAGQGVDVKFSGTSTAGSTFTQTVLRAYTVKGS
jgi:hypothetical protein